MRVQFDYDIDDQVDATLRSLHGSPAGRRHLLATRAMSAAIFGLLAGAVTVALIPGDFEARMPPAVASALVLAAIQWIGYPGALRRTLRRRLPGLLGSRGPFTCEVELRPEGVWVRQNQTQQLYEWNSVVSIEETADTIDFRTGTGGYLVVRDRAFWSPDEREKFLKTARRLREIHADGGERVFSSDLA